MSVIVPHYNRPGTLREAVHSIHNQTVRPEEIVVVDDCSRPEARRVLGELSSIAMIVSTPKNVGLSGARNYGARQARGKWLAFLDDDDLFVPNKIETQIRYLNEHPGCVALGSGFTMKPPEGPGQYWGGKTTRRLTLADALYYTASMAQALMIRRDAFLQLGGFDERLRCMEDYEFGIRIIAAGLDMQFLAEPLFIYHLGGRDQLTRSWMKMLRAECRILGWHRELCRQEFGRLGYFRMVARACRVRGLRRGRLPGRAVWLAGFLSDSLIGAERGEYGW